MGGSLPPESFLGWGGRCRFGSWLFGGCGKLAVVVCAAGIGIVGMCVTAARSLRREVGMLALSAGHGGPPGLGRGSSPVAGTWINTHCCA